MQMDDVGKETEQEKTADSNHDDHPVEDEKILRKRGCYIPSDSTFRQTWDFVITVALLYITFAVPVFLAFYENIDAPDMIGFKRFDFLLDITFLCDIPINFFSEVIDEDGKLVNDNCKIVKDYMTGWFVLDTVSSIPFGWFSQDSRMANAKAAKVIRVMKMMKMLRMSKFAKLVPKLQEQFEIKNSTMDVFKFLVLIFATAHWLGCTFFIISRFEGFQQNSWTNRYIVDLDVDGEPIPLRDASVSDQYLCSLYWAFTTMSTIGFGDITPGTSAERGFMCVAMCIGGGVFAFGLTNMCALVVNMNRSKVEFAGLQDRMKEFLESRAISHSLRKTVSRYLFYRHFSSSIDIFEEYKVLAYLSPSLRSSVMVEITSNIFNGVPLLYGYGDRFLHSIAEKLEAIPFPAGEKILQKGDVVKNIWLIGNGQVEVLTDLKMLVERKQKMIDKLQGGTSQSKSFLSNLFQGQKKPDPDDEDPTWESHHSRRSCELLELVDDERNGANRFREAMAEDVTLHLQGESSDNSQLVFTANQYVLQRHSLMCKSTALVEGQCDFSAFALTFCDIYVCKARDVYQVLSDGGKLTQARDLYEQSVEQGQMHLDFTPDPKTPDLPPEEFKWTRVVVRDKEKVKCLATIPEYRIVAEKLTIAHQFPLAKEFKDDMSIENFLYDEMAEPIERKASLDPADNLNSLKSLTPRSRAPSAAATYPLRSRAPSAAATYPPEVAVTMSEVLRAVQQLQSEVATIKSVVGKDVEEIKKQVEMIGAGAQHLPVSVP